MTHSHVKWAKQFTKAKPFECTCGRCSGGKPGVHKAEDIFPNIFAVCSKFTPEPDDRALRGELVVAMRNMITAMQDHGVLSKHTWQNLQGDIDRFISSCVQKTPNNKAPAAPVSKLDVIRASRGLRRWVVIPIDKDAGSTCLMCPREYWHRLDALYSCASLHYEEVGKSSDLVFTDLVQGLADLNTLPAKANDGAIPYGYLMPKSKDLNKSRPVVSYFKHPQKRKLNFAGRALMWLLHRLQHKGLSKSFSSFDTRDYAATMADVKLPPGTKVYLGDVKNMYTNIDHVNLNEVIRWVLNLARKNLGHDLSIFVPNAKSKRPCLADEAKAGVPGSKISLDNIEEIVKWDVANIYFTLGDKTVRQTMGIPMGSPCSPALAVAVCMHAEHKFAEMHPEVVVHYGFRYIDDLLLFLRENSNLIGGIYPPPLQLEEEAGIELADGSYEFRFLETWTRLTPDGRLDISHHHKNTHRASRGQAQVKNVAHFSSHVPPHQKFGRVVGALTSAWSHSVGHPNKVKAAVRVLHDMRHHGMSNETARAAMRRMEFKTVDPVWTSEIASRFFR